MTATETAEPREISRRALVRTAMVGATAGAGVLPSLLAASPASAAPFVSGDPDVHLLRRATFGPTQASLKQLRAKGANAWIEQQLTPGSIKDDYVEGLIAKRYPDLDMPLRRAYNTLEGSWDLMFQLGQAAILRATWSNRQLFEVMVDFWSNHLNVTNPSDNVWWSRHDYDRQVIRRHALGKFSDMLKASAIHPAMMLYLNNAESTKDNPNENYGREILELHTMGVGGGYDEEDMRESTLTLTGFGVDWETGEFRYDKDNHYVGRVRVAGWSRSNDTPGGGYKVGLSYVDYLAHHPSTAKRIATKLCRHFVSDDPPNVLVNKLAQVYLRNDTAIRPVLRELFRSTQFKASKGEKVRRPFEDVAATMRVLDIRPDAKGTDGLQGLYWVLDGFGHAPMRWSQPDGYPDYAAAWSSAGGRINSWNRHLAFAGGWWPDTLRYRNLRTTLVPKPLPATHGKLIDALAKKLVFRTLTTAHRTAVLDFLGVSASTPLDGDDAAVNWRLEYVAALILDSPYHGIR